MGANQFIAFPLVGPGSAGPQASIDLFALAPPTGLDQSLTFICKGEFQGQIAIEGSADDVNFDVISQFDAGLDADGSMGPSLEFSPKKANAVVRFLRLLIRAAVAPGTTTQVSVAAEDNCPCSIFEICGLEALAIALTTAEIDVGASLNANPTAQSQAEIGMGADLNKNPIALTTASIEAGPPPSPPVNQTLTVTVLDICAV